MKDEYFKPKEISEQLNVSVQALKKHRQKGNLKKIKWSIGGRIPYYEINEVKKLFHKN